MYIYIYIHTHVYCLVNIPDHGSVIRLVGSVFRSYDASAARVHPNFAICESVRKRIHAYYVS